MIASFFVSASTLVLSFLLGLLPEGTLPVSVSSSLTSIWGMVNAFSYLIALDTLIVVLVLVIGFDLIVLLWHIIQWIIRKVPGMQ